MKVFTAMYRPTPLLPHFVRHYAFLGFTDIYIAAASEALDGVDWCATTATALPARLHVEPLYEGVFDNSRDSAVMNAMKARHVQDANEWCSIVDLDEFAEFPMPLADFAAIPPQYNCIEGTFVDHITTDGTLPVIHDGTSIFAQFPVECRLTKKLLGGCDRKIMASRGFHSLGRGQHSLENGHPAPQPGKVHHFKWSAIAIAHLTERLQNGKKTGYRWPHESQRFLDHWHHHGRIALAHI